jgi:SAM-dependent methyltransferase
MDASYARHYHHYYARHWWWRAREEFILWNLERLRPGGGWGRILDVGCGDGLFFEKLQGIGDVEGIEMDSTTGASGGRWADRIQIRPFDESFRPDRAYALILMLDLLEHLSDPLPSLRRAVELLQPGGTILITVPAFPVLWTSHDELNHHFRRYTRTSLSNLVREAGARIEGERYFFQWPALLKLAIHLKERLVPASPRLPRSPNPWVNQILYRLSRAELATLGRISFPFGSSLLAWAGKVG